MFSYYFDDHLAVSYNQPKFCSTALWDPNAESFAAEITVGREPHGIFVDKNNNIYVPNRSSNTTVIWYNNSKKDNKTFTGNLASPQNVFVT